MKTTYAKKKDQLELDLITDKKGQKKAILKKDSSSSEELKKFKATAKPGSKKWVGSSKRKQKVKLKPLLPE